MVFCVDCGQDLTSPNLVDGARTFNPSNKLQGTCRDFNLSSLEACS
jgi:hypothetical protein